MNPLFQALDTDKDGELSAAEIANAPAALKTLDKNKDGKLRMVPYHSVLWMEQTTI
jgi:Ca2+-binding EF-hand superfamily protein